MTDSPHGSTLDLSVRLGGLQLARLLISGLALVAAIVMPDRFQLAPATIAWSAVTYAATTTGLELVRRRARVRLVTLASGLLVVDAVFVAFVSVFDSGPTGPLSFLPALHVVAVAFLAGPVSGLRLAVVYVSLLFAALVYHTAQGELRDTPSAYALAAVGTVSLAVVLLVTQGVVERANRRRNQRLAALARFAEGCQQAPSADDIIDSLVSSVRQAFGFEEGAVALHGGEGENDEVVLLRRLGPEHEPIRAELGNPTNVVLIPLCSGGRQLGVAAFAAGSRVPGLPREDLGLIERFCGHAALAIGNAQLRAEIERLATTDPLTGLANRRRFDETFAAEVGRTRRHGLSLGVVTVDIDHFKSVNDTHGHAVGDEVLVAVGEVLAGQCRLTDLAARTGGEEFVVLLPETDLSGTAMIAERIRQAIADASTPIPVTISAGVAAFPATTADPQRLLVATDEALYRAKERGRDQVCTAQPVDPDPAPPGEGAVGLVRHG